jgi:hypothetical protein
MLTSQQVGEFHANGFVIARGVFHGRELEDLRRAARRLQDKAKQHLYPGTRYWYQGSQSGEGVPPESRAAATWGVNEITRPELFDPALVNVFGHATIDHDLHALLGPEPRAWGIKMLWTPKVMPYNLGWHRDQMAKDLYDYVYLKPAANDHVQFNAALNEDRCFLVVPGSHRRALTPVEWQAVLVQRTKELPGQVEAALHPGDVLYMDAHALHRGRSNIEEDRLTLHYSAQAQWVPLQSWGEPEHFAWLLAPAFLDQLTPATRPYYERLGTASQTTEMLCFLKDAARVHGFKG